MIQLQVILKTIHVIRLDLQWIIGIGILVVKELNDRVVGKFVSKISMVDNIDAKITAKIHLSWFFTFWLAIVMATSATALTCYCILGISFGINIVLCLKIIRLHKRAAPNDSAKRNNITLKEESLTELILNETMEISVPVLFVSTFTVAYYGPNASVLGNVGNGYWHYQPTKDLKTLFTPVFEIFLIDSSSALINGVLLWKFCHLDVIEAYCRIVKKYWVVLTISAIAMLNKVGIKCDRNYNYKISGNCNIIHTRDL
jgi:hypothetical protein